jgi:hypothetical protein
MYWNRLQIKWDLKEKNLVWVVILLTSVSLETRHTAILYLLLFASCTDTVKLLEA